ncbi:hypothetical protein ACFU99_06130 [Streptomyces sp. NPDC057654]|uniref:hypothetical protein n=1 Tax=Streptomyces sp. NPDC057654 TaxID=3346196 RepID=UPI0036A45B01
MEQDWDISLEKAVGTAPDLTDMDMNAEISLRESEGPDDDSKVPVGAASYPAKCASSP